jgi:hypothetical protein
MSIARKASSVAGATKAFRLKMTMPPPPAFTIGQGHDHMLNFQRPALARYLRPRRSVLKLSPTLTAYSLFNLMLKFSVVDGLFGQRLSPTNSTSASLSLTSFIVAS